MHKTVGIRRNEPGAPEGSPRRGLWAPDVEPLAGSIGPSQRNLWVLQKNWRLSLAFASTVLVGVIVAACLMAPVYEPKARIEINPPSDQVFSLPDGATSDPGAQNYLETQIEILQSSELALATIQALHLDQNPELVPSSKLTQLTAAAVRWFTFKRGSRDQDADESRQDLALKSFAERLSVAQVRQSRVVEVSFASHDPTLAAQVTNSLLDIFIQRQHDTRYGPTIWVSQQLEDLRQKIANENRALAEFQNTNGLMDVSDGQNPTQNQPQNTVTQKVSELNQQLTTAEADRIQLEAYVKMAEGGNTDSLPLVQNSPLMQGLTQRFVDTRAQLAQAHTIYGENNSNVKKLESEENELAMQLAAERRRTLDQLATSYQSAKTRESLLRQALEKMRGEVGRMNEKVVQYNFLKREAQANEDLYNTLSTRLKEVGVAAGMQSGSMLVVDHARVLKHPTRPHRLQLIAVGLFMGLLGALALPFFKEALDDSIHSAADVRTWTGLVTLGSVPLIEGANGNKRKLRYSPGYEALQNLRVAIELCPSERPPRIVLVASPAPREGKTTIANRLVIVLASHGPTCLIDADLRHARVGQSTVTSSPQGLSDVLRGSAELGMVLKSHPDIPNLAILPAGSVPASPGELITSESMRGILQILRQRFANIVIDSPPLIPFPDARILSTLVDGVILVGRCGVTSRQNLVASAAILEEVRAPLLGVVLNGAKSDSWYYDYYE